MFDNNIFCFDIETSSAWYTPERKLIGFDKTLPKDYWKSCVPFSLVYIWQFGVNDKVVFGRDLEEFSLLLDELVELVDEPTIWVHNLSYEMQFLLNIFDVETTFARKSHKPMYITGNGIKFRCSYFLTRLSLEAWAKQHGKCKKLVGSLDYSLLRTPNTKLTSKEFAYCENDILCMYYGLCEYLKKYGTIENIPLTQTGEVRRVVKNMYKKNGNYHKKMTNLLPRNAEEYNFMRKAFAGGYTHANYLHANKLLYNVHSMDIASSYPFVMISERFPSSKWYSIRPYEIDKYRNENYSLLIDVTFYNIESKMSMRYISTSKCMELEPEIIRNGKRITNTVTDNGRLVKADSCRMVITNIDLDIIEQTYKIGEVKYNKIMYSNNEYLDSDFVQYILQLYENKTSLKGITAMEDIYLQSKQFINALYGMSVTDIVSDNAIWDNDLDKWIPQKGDADEVLEELRSKPYKNFLAYQHGIWVTAYARRNLWKIIVQFSDDVVYVDTDSVKYINNHDAEFDTYNKEVIEKLKVSMSKHRIPLSATAPLTKKGEPKQIGIYEREKDYQQFKTLGAKRYCYRYYPKTYKLSYKNIKPRKGQRIKIYHWDYNVHITVSGVNKEKGRRALKHVSDFTNKFEFDTDHTGKLLFTYSNNMPKIIWNKGEYDEFKSYYRYGINAQPTTYNMSLSDEFDYLLMEKIQEFL